MALNEANTRAKLIDPALHTRGWTEDIIRCEETSQGIDIIGGKRGTGKPFPNGSQVFSSVAPDPDFETFSALDLCVGQRCTEATPKFVSSSSWWVCPGIESSIRRSCQNAR
jgi:hypothetical protein